MTEIAATELQEAVSGLVGQITDTMSWVDAAKFLTDALFRMHDKKQIVDFMVRVDPVDRTRIDIAIKIAELAEFTHFPIILETPLKETHDR